MAKKVASKIARKKGKARQAPRRSSDRKKRLRAEAALKESESRFDLLADSIPQLAWMANPDGWIFWYNQRWFDYTGTTLEDMKGWGWRKVHHPDHIDRVVARVQKSWETGEPWEDTFPLRSHDGKWRWFLSRALPIRDESGKVVRWFGTNTDITELREAEERQRLLLDELNHRVKNTLATVQSIAHMTLRHIENPSEFEANFTPRLHALSRSHNLLAQEAWQGALLADLVTETLAPYAPGGDSSRASVDGPHVRLGPTAAVTLGMALHELATNSAKYGALSNDSGRVDVSWSIDWRAEPTPMVDLSWIESGGPPVTPPRRRGFGSRMIEAGVARDFKADVKLDFNPSGVQCRIKLPLSGKVSATRS